MTSAVTTSAHDAAERRIAARALLLTPVLTTDRHPDTMRLVRRHGPALRAMFATQLGYTLIVESTFARLLKAPPEPGLPGHPPCQADPGHRAGRTTTLRWCCAGGIAPCRAR